MSRVYAVSARGTPRGRVGNALSAQQNCRVWSGPTTPRSIDAGVGTGRLERRSKGRGTGTLVGMGKPPLFGIAFDPFQCVGASHAPQHHSHTGTSRKDGIYSAL